jgi:hypothetical protein
VSHISENDPLPKPALDLSKLLLDQSGTIKGKLLFKLKLLHPPKPFWHARTTKCLAKKECCPLQSTTERQCIVLEVRRNILLKFDFIFIFSGRI